MRTTSLLANIRAHFRAHDLSHDIPAQVSDGPQSLLLNHVRLPCYEHIHLKSAASLVQNVSPCETHLPQIPSRYVKASVRRRFAYHHTSWTQYRGENGVKIIGTIRIPLTERDCIPATQPYQRCEYYTESHEGENIAPEPTGHMEASFAEARMFHPAHRERILSTG